MKDADPRDATAMEFAIEASRSALESGNEPYGAALVAPSGEILHVAGNQQHTSGDCTAHAEMVVVREATARYGLARLAEATVYASGEPCAMCAGALYWAGVRRVVYAASSPLMAEVMGGELLPVRCADVLAGATRPVRVDGGFMAAEAVDVLEQAALRRRSAAPPQPGSTRSSDAR